MKILIVKTSSLGDIIHTLPALTDAAHFMPEIHFDWVAEKSFAQIPAWHPKVNKVIPVSWRRWRKHLLTYWQKGELQSFYHDLRSTTYDKIIDAQGLVKSAIMAKMAKGEHCGLDFESARETLAACFYQKRYQVIFRQHAVVRTRQLFAKVLGYDVPEGMPDYGILHHFPQPTVKHLKDIIFFHGTTWETKKWPEAYWIKLAQYCVASGFRVLLPWGNEEEHQRAQHIFAAEKGAEVLPKLSLGELAELLTQSTAAVAVDTGLGHLAAALNVPTLSLYGPTHPEQIGACGENQFHLSAPGEVGKGVLAELLPDVVWEQFQAILKG